MKITVKQLQTLIIEALKEQATAGAPLASGAATSNQAQIQALTAVLQSIMNYAAVLYGGRSGYLPTLGSRQRRSVQIAERSVLGFGNRALTSLDTLASVPAAANAVTTARRAIQTAQEELRRMQAETRDADLASMDLNAFGARLRTLREQIIQGAYRPLAAIRRSLGGAPTNEPGPAPDPRSYIASFTSGIASALPTAPSAEDASFASMISGLASGGAPATGIGSTEPASVERATADIGRLRAVPETGLRPEGTPIREVALRRFIKQEIKKYLR